MNVTIDLALAVSLASSIASAIGAWTVLRRTVADHARSIDDLDLRITRIEHWRSREAGAARAVARDRTGPIPVLEDSGSHDAGGRP